MNILAFDTSTAACSVALYTEREESPVVFSRHAIIPKQHTTTILPMIQALLDEAGMKMQDLQAIAFGAGPGSLTGVRIAVSLAQGLAYAHQIPVIPISSLNILAQTAYDELGDEQILVLMDARMHEVYAGWYQLKNGVMTEVCPDQIQTPDQVSIKITPYTGVGDGFKAYNAQLMDALQPPPSNIADNLFPNATSMLALAIKRFQHGESINAKDAAPHYLR